MQPLVISGVRVIDGTGTPPREHDVVAVEGDRLSARPVPGALELDGRGLTALPGLVNCHAHVMIDPATGSAGGGADAWELLRAMTRMRAALDAGITTIRDLAGVRYLELALRRAVEEGLVDGPRLVCAGMRLTMTGGFFSEIGQEVDGVEAVRAAVRANRKAGADLVKLVASGGPRATSGRAAGAPELTFEELDAGVQEAARLGMRTAAHAIGREAIHNAARARVTSVEHGNHLDAEAIDLMLAGGCILVPTLSVLHFGIEHAAEAGFTASQVDQTRRALDAAMTSVASARAAGIPIALGTDAGTLGNYHDDIVTEFQLLLQAGQSPMDVLVSATSTGAALCGLENLGTLEQGKFADVVLLHGDPLERPETLRSPALVIKEGRPVAGTLLDRLREAVRTGRGTTLSASPSAPR